MLRFPTQNARAQMVAMSLRFYAAQRSGVLPADNPIPWRGDSALGDFAPNGASLVGGYFDDGGVCVRRLGKHSACIFQHAYHQSILPSLAQHISNPGPCKNAVSRPPQHWKSCGERCHVAHATGITPCSNKSSLLLGGTNFCESAGMDDREATWLLQLSLVLPQPLWQGCL